MLYYIPTTVCFSTKLPSSQGVLKIKYHMSNMYCRCQSPSLSLKVLKCYNSKLQMLTSTVHTAVITTYSNGAPLLYCSQMFIFSGLCTQISLTIYNPMWSHTAEAYNVSHVRVYSVLLYLLLINICWIHIYFGKLVFLYKFIIFCWYASLSILIIVLPLSDFVFINYFLLAFYEFVLLYVLVFCIKCLLCWVPYLWYFLACQSNKYFSAKMSCRVFCINH